MRLRAPLLCLLAAACASVPTPAKEGPPEASRAAAEQVVEQERQAPDIKSPGPDLGSVPNSAQVVPPGRAYVETNFNSVRTHDRTVRTNFVPVLLRFGVAQDVELRAFVNVVSHQAAPDGDVAWGGPAAFGFKGRLNRGGPGFLHPSFALEGNLVFPVASAQMDGGKLVPYLALNVDHFVTERGTLTWNLGALAPVDDAGQQYAQGLFAASYVQSLADALQLFVAVDTSAPAARAGGGSISALGTGLYWYVTKRVVLFGAFDWGLTGDSPFTRANVGLALAL